MALLACADATVFAAYGNGLGLGKTLSRSAREPGVGTRGPQMTHQRLADYPTPVGDWPEHMARDGHARGHALRATRE